MNISPLIKKFLNSSIIHEQSSKVIVIPPHTMSSGVGAWDPTLLGMEKLLLFFIYVSKGSNCTHHWLVILLEYGEKGLGHYSIISSLGSWTISAQVVIFELVKKHWLWLTYNADQNKSKAPLLCQVK